MSLPRTALALVLVGLSVTASIALATYPEPRRAAPAAPEAAQPAGSGSAIAPSPGAGEMGAGPGSAADGFLGVLLARHSVDLAPRSEGRLSAVHVRLGDAVPAGGLVATVDVPALRYDLGMARASLEAAKVDEQRAAIELAQAEELLKRRTSLSQSALATGEELSSAGFQEKLARTRVEAARATLAERSARVGQLRQQNADAEIRAPFDGIVTARYLDPGANITSSTPIVRIISANDLFVRFAVPEERARALVVGNPVRVTAAASTLRGKIEKVAPEIDAASRMVVVEAQVEVEGTQARSGEMVRVALGEAP
jgi:RND family efflux transporter MFP subunit